MQKSKAERIAALKAKLEAEKARLAKLEAQQATEDRKLETRCKIIIGGGVMAHSAIDPDFGYALAKALSHAVIRPQDQATITRWLAHPDRAHMAKLFAPTIASWQKKKGEAQPEALPSVSVSNTAE